MSEKKDCTTCKWSHWVMTNHNPPRINKKEYGECQYVINKSDLIIPKCIDINIKKIIEYNRSVIWFDHVHEDCQVWEPK